MNKALAFTFVTCMLFSVGCDQPDISRNQKTCPTAIEQFQCNSNIKKNILATHAQITSSAEQLDVDKFFSFIAENSNGSIVQDGTLLLTRQQALESTRASFAQIKELEYEFDSRHLTVLSPNSAILVSKGKTISTINDGRTFTTPFVNSSIFVLENNQWKILHGHHSIPNTN